MCWFHINVQLLLLKSIAAENNTTACVTSRFVAFLIHTFNGRTFASAHMLHLCRGTRTCFAALAAAADEAGWWRCCIKYHLGHSTLRMLDCQRQKVHLTFLIGANNGWQIHKIRPDQCWL